MNSIKNLVLFGASGDLTRKMLIPALYQLEQNGVLDQKIVGVALDDWDTERFTKHVSAAIGAAFPDVDRQVEAALLDRLHYLAGDYRDASTYQRLANEVGAKTKCLAYLAIPPSFFETVISGLAAVDLARDTRFLVEKPFGRDLESARDLNQVLHQYQDESEIFRIDHFLGKEPIESLLAFRYANPMIEAVWSRDYIDHIQITMAESFGVQDRGVLYEALGVIRDVVENHLLQMVCLLTMEAPTRPDADAIADARANVLKATATISPRDVVYGQFESYRSISSVADDSTVPTFVALSLAIDLPRWRGVPIYIRAGKSLAITATEAVVVFRQPPPLSFSPEKAAPKPNQLVFRISPRPGIDLRLQTKMPGEGLQLVTTPLSVNYDTVFGAAPLAYEHVLRDALAGDRSQFAREDAVEEAWRIVGDILEVPTTPEPYGPGTWGPRDSGKVLTGGRHWIKPT